MRSNSLPITVFKIFFSPLRTSIKFLATTRTSVVSSSVTSTTTYSTSGWTAMAVFETKVHGVVVHTNSDASNSASSPEVTGKRTKTDGSVTVSYPCANS